MDHGMGNYRKISSKPAWHNLVPSHLYFLKSTITQDLPHSQFITYNTFTPASTFFRLVTPFQMPGKIISHIFSSYLPQKPRKPSVLERATAPLRATKIWRTLKNVAAQIALAREPPSYLLALQSLPASVESCEILESAVTSWGKHGEKLFINESECKSLIAVLCLSWSLVYRHRSADA
jgi:hypothetical protein